MMVSDNLIIKMSAYFDFVVNIWSILQPETHEVLNATMNEFWPWSLALFPSACSSYWFWKLEPFNFPSRTFGFLRRI